MAQHEPEAKPQPSSSDSDVVRPSMEADMSKNSTMIPATSWFTPKR